jgi:hypothetical protein
MEDYEEFVTVGQLRKYLLAFSDETPIVLDTWDGYNDCPSVMSYVQAVGKDGVVRFH